MINDELITLGAKEVKVLVDLALGRASGQGNIEVGKVKHFRDAVTGYMPFIYRVVPTDGFNQVLEHCKNVWKTLSIDPKLPEKLVCTLNISCPHK